MRPSSGVRETLRCQKDSSDRQDRRAAGDPVSGNLDSLAGSEAGSIIDDFTTDVG